MSIIQDYGLIIGGIFAMLAAFFRKNNVNQLNQYINTINIMRVDLTNLKKESSDNAKFIRQLQLDLHDKDKLVALLEATSWDLPFPYWLKDMQCQMIYINQKYEKTFNIRSVDYIGKKDTELWPGDQASKFSENDLKLINTDTEYLIDDQEVPGYVVIKWKRWAGNILIGVAGMCIPKELFHQYPQQPPQQ